MLWSSASVLYKIPGLQPKLATRWEKVLWLGKRNTTDEHIIGDEGGNMLLSIPTESVSHQRSAMPRWTMKSKIRGSNAAWAAASRRGAGLL